jgi:small subunit ribosomal protein S20
MPQIKSAGKRMRQAVRRRDENRALKSRVLTTRRKLYSAVQAGDRAGCQAVFREYCSVLDRAVKKGTLKANAASRRKARAAHRMAAMA